MIIRGFSLLEKDTEGKILKMQEIGNPDEKKVRFRAFATRAKNISRWQEPGSTFIEQKTHLKIPILLQTDPRPYLFSVGSVCHQMTFCFANVVFNM